MEMERVAVDRVVGQPTFSWARFAVMLALIGTPCIACACLVIKRQAPEVAQAAPAVPATVHTDSRPLVIVIPSASAPAPAQQHGAQDAAPASAPSRAPASASPVVQEAADSRFAPSTPAAQVAQAAADADSGQPASLPGSVIQTAATEPPVPQLPPLPGRGEVSSAPVAPALPSPAILPPATLPVPAVAPTVTRTDESTSPVAVLPAPDGVQAPAPIPPLTFPTPVSGPQDPKKPAPVNPALDIPTPPMLPIPMPSEKPTAPAACSANADMSQPTAQELEAIRNHVDGIVEPNCVLDLVQGRTRVLKLKKPARSVQVSGTDVIQCTPINSREIALQARTIGTTLLHLTFSDADKAQDVEVRYLVRVVPALTAREPYEGLFRALEAEIAGMFPESKVQLRLVGDAVLITGQVREARDVTPIVQLVVANTPWADRHATATSGEASTVAGSSSSHVINRLQIARPVQHQVALKVAVVELSRNALWALCGKGPEAQVAGATREANPSAGPIVPVVYDMSDGRMSAAFGAAALFGVKSANGPEVRALPEPRQLLLHGQPASLVASGECLVTASREKATVDKATAERSVTLGLHGIDLSFTPVCVEGESLRLTVATSTGRPGTGRPFQSTLAVREGQTLAFTGLLPPALERDPHRIAARRSILGRITGAEATPDRETVILVLPEAVVAH
jgi:Flp pilus assembly secretin CpaC